MNIRDEGLVRSIRAVVCLLAANRGSNCSLMRAMDGRIVPYGVIGSCQSAANSESASGHQSDSKKEHYSKCRILTFSSCTECSK